MARGDLRALNAGVLIMWVAAAVVAWMAAGLMVVLNWHDFRLWALFSAVNLALYGVLIPEREPAWLAGAAFLGVSAVSACMALNEYYYYPWH